MAAAGTYSWCINRSKVAEMGWLVAEGTRKRSMLGSNDSTVARQLIARDSTLTGGEVKDEWRASFRVSFRS